MVDLDVGNAKSGKESNDDTSSNDSHKADVIALEISESLQQEQILTAFVVNNKTGCIMARLNHVYDKKTIVSDISQNWIKTIDTFATGAKEKGVSDETGITHQLLLQNIFLSPLVN